MKRSTELRLLALLDRIPAPVSIAFVAAVWFWILASFLPSIP